MTQQADLNYEGIEKKPLSEFTEKAYLDYSMYVILDRALPHIGDGLKPVQRRIVYAMSELGLKNTAKFKKSARTVGDVLGKFHPHGDSACYEAMVLMAQDFSYRYPLIDGQGNWGSSDDPKSFAAMRYTESRLTQYADTLLQEINLGTVDWGPNFDGSLEEPKLLPAQLPNVLLNGGTGIAVGMATDIPPHNLHEVVAASVHLLENPQASVAELCEYILAPDFPTAAEIITPLQEIRAVYEKGQGSIKMRAVYRQEQGEILITALPHQVSGAKILEQIAAQMQAKKLPMVIDLRDESDHENPTRIVIVPRSNRVDIDEIMSHLFATTDLEKNYRINLNMIGLNGRPQVKNLRMILQEWLTFRTEVTSRRLQHRLEKVLARLHILDGLLIAFLNIDEVIRIIREEEQPKTELMRAFQLSAVQAEAILDLKLRHLARLEEEKITAEQQQLSDERDKLQKTLSSQKRLQTLIKKELQAAAKAYGDKRRSPLVRRSEAKALSKVIQMPSEAVTVVLSQKGWVRAGKGHEVEGANLSYKAGDSFLQQVEGKSNQAAVFLDSTGRTYAVYAHALPSARGQGEPLTGRFNPPAGASFLSVLMGENAESYLMLSSHAYGFLSKLENMITKNRNGKQFMKVSEQADLLMPLAVAETDGSYVAMATLQGNLLLVPITEVVEMDKGKGAKLMALDHKALKAGKEAVVAACVLQKGQGLQLHSSKKKKTLSYKEWKSYIGERAAKGAALPKGFTKIIALTQGN